MEAYIVGGYRTAVGKAPRGKFRFVRPDELGVTVIKRLLADFRQLDVELIDDVVVGNAFPEAEQGFNIGRMISLSALNTVTVPGMTVNRYCASGLEAIAVAANKIRCGQAQIVLAGGVESMSLIPMGGWRPVPNFNLAKNHTDYYHNMGLTAETVAREYHISRADQDEFGLQSNLKALKAMADGKFTGEIAPVTVNHVYFNAGERKSESYIVDSDEGPRSSSMEKMAALKPVFAEGGTVTAGNSSQMSDGAAFVLLVSETMLKSLQLEPIARLVEYQTAGVEPRKMGIGPVASIPKALTKSGLSIHDIGIIELNEAFAAQSLAVIRALNLNPDTINVNGGAIAMGHPLGCTGAKLTVQIMNELKRTNQRYGMVTMCVGTGQGATGIFERF